MAKIRSELERDMENTLDEWRKRVSRQRHQIIDEDDDEEDDDEEKIPSDDIIVGDTDESEDDVIDRLGRVSEAGTTTTTTTATAKEKTTSEATEGAMSDHPKTLGRFSTDETDLDDEIRVPLETNDKTKDPSEAKPERKKKKRRRKRKTVETDVSYVGGDPTDFSGSTDVLQDEQTRPNKMQGHVKMLWMQLVFFAVVTGQLILQFFI